MRALVLRAWRACSPPCTYLLTPPAPLPLPSPPPSAEFYRATLAEGSMVVNLVWGSNEEGRLPTTQDKEYDSREAAVEAFHAVCKTKGKSACAGAAGRRSDSDPHPSPLTLRPPFSAARPPQSTRWQWHESSSSGP